MTTERSIPRAEIMEKVALHTARILLVLALVHAASFTSHFVSETMAGYLGFLEKGLAVLTVAIGIAALRLLFKKRSTQRHHPEIEPESFINDVMKKSFSIAWAVTLFLLILLDLGDGKFIVELPVNLLMDLIKMILLGTFSVSFFVLNKDGDMDEAGQGLSE